VTNLTLTEDEVAMFYAIFTGAERVDWACYEAFRLAVVAEGEKRYAAASRAGHPTDRHQEPTTAATHFDVN
jgi:hypothetical protein